MIYRTQAAPHLSFVDGLRAVAILGVVIFHVSLHASSGAMSRPLALVYQGMHGVELFFVISGFCLAYPLITRFHSSGSFSFDVRTYAAKRLVRIFPPYLVALALLIGLSALAEWQRPIVAEHVSAGAFSLVDIGKEAVLLDAGPLHNKSFWSLALELRWYAIFPLAIMLFLRAPKSLWYICLLSWVLYYQSTAGAADLLELPAFLLGIIAADAYIRQPRWIRLAPYVLLAATAIGLGFQPFTRFPYWQVAAFGVVLCAVWSDGFRRALSWRPLTFIGISSYSIYLVHEPVIAWAQARGASPVVSFAIALGCGITFWAIVERPLMQRENHQRVVAFVSAALGRLWAYLSTPVHPANLESGDGAETQPQLPGPLVSAR